MIPARKLNGGLYTGEAFASSAWGNHTAARPDAGEMVREGLRYGNVPPPGAALQYVSSCRPGNSDPDTSGLVADPETGFMFLPCPQR